MTLSLMPPKVSVIVPTYCSGPGLDAVMSSLVAQTLGKDEFEAVFVDDGSPDRTYDRLREFATEHAWVKVDQIPNSGWPGRPRNVGVRRATGRYVFFMDHDDYLFPDALRRMWEFAEANDLDVVHAKEVVDGWSTPAWLAFRTQVPRGYDRYTFDDITPHKLYRRSFLIDQEVWFREGRVRLEDIDFNVRAWMRTDAIGVMADYPVYKWILHVDNSHKKGSPTYWEDLKLAVQPLHDECTDGQKRSFILARIYRRQILDRLGPGLLERSEEARTQLAVDLRDQLPHFPEEVDARLDPPRRARSALLRRGDWTGLMDLARADLGLMLFTTSVSFDWVDSQLELSVVGVIGDAQGTPMTVHEVGTRILRHLPAELAERFRDSELDLTDDLAGAHGECVVRSRRDRIDWTIPSMISQVWVQSSPDGTGQVRYRVGGRIDPRTAAFGAALEEDRHDVFHRILGLGYTGVHRVRAPEDTDSTALLQGLPMRVTASTAGFAVLDVDGMAPAVARGLAGSPHQLTMSRTSAALDTQIDLPTSGTWSQEGVLAVSIYGLYEEPWAATLRSAGGTATLHAQGPTPPRGLHRAVLHMGEGSTEIGWLSHERLVGRSATLTLLDQRAARDRARAVAHDSRVPHGARVRRRVRRALRVKDTQ